MNHAQKYVKVSPAGGDTSTPLNLQKRLTVIKQYAGTLANTKIIDCGCGAGEYLFALSDLGADVWGIEYEEGKIAKFQEKHRHLSDRVISGDIEKINFDDNSFDLALLNEVLEHVPDDKQTLREIYRILKPGGLLILFSPNRIYPFETHGVYRKGSKKKIPHYIPFIPYIPVNIGNLFFDYWARNYWPGELRTMVKQTKFEIVHLDFTWQTFENISGNQPYLLKISSPLLRTASSLLERIPVIRTLGVSQVIIARK